MPDFAARRRPCETVLAAAARRAGNHNLETVPRLYGEVRPGRRYRRSPRRCWPRPRGARADAGAPHARQDRPHARPRARPPDEVAAVLADCVAAGVDLVTVGQYLRPAAGCLPVVRYVPPDEFAALEPLGERLGLRVVAGPLVRSSYRAAETFAAGG